MTPRARNFVAIAGLSILLAGVLLVKFGISHRVDVVEPQLVQDVLAGQDIWFLPDGSIRSSYQRGSCVVLSRWTQGASPSRWSGVYKAFDLSKSEPWKGAGTADVLPIPALRDCRATEEPVWATDPQGRYLAVFAPGDGLRITVMPEDEGVGSADNLKPTTTEILEFGGRKVLDLEITSTGVAVVLFADGVVELWSLEEWKKGIAGVPLGPDWKLLDRKGKFVLAASEEKRALNGMVVESPDRMNQWSRAYPALESFGLAGISAPGCFAGGAPDSGALTPVCLSYLWHDQRVGHFAPSVKAGTFAVPPGSKEFVVYGRERIIVGGQYPGLYLSKEAVPLRKLATPQEETLALDLHEDLVAVQTPEKLTALRLGHKAELNRVGAVLAWGVPVILSLLAFFLAILQDG